jgi:hypothetical protein
MSPLALSSSISDCFTFNNASISWLCAIILAVSACNKSVVNAVGKLNILALSLEIFVIHFKRPGSIFTNG